jgi:hypothetical protein
VTSIDRTVYRRLKRSYTTKELIEAYMWFASLFVLTGLFIGQWQGWIGYGSKLQSGSLA